MIKKFISVRNIGKLVNYSASGDIELKKLNIIYGENSSGKTTLCAILKSLKTGKADYIIGRKSFHSAEAPNVNILFEGENVKYSDSKWDRCIPELEIFDSSFVAENVHAGHDVHHYHKKSLHSFAIGEEGVRLSNEIQVCDTKIRELNTTMSEVERKILRHIIGSLPVEDFIKLTKDEDVARKIQEKNALIKALEQAEEIKIKNKLSEIHLSEWRLESLKAVLTRSLEDISKEADALIKRHIDECLDEKGERWLNYGLEHVKDNKCPFCGRNLDSLGLINAYRQYFNEKYIEFKSEIASELEKEKAKLAIEKLIGLQRLIGSNETLMEYWRQHITIESALPEYLYEKTEQAWKSLSEKVTAAIERKASNILEAFEPADELLTDVRAIEEIKVLIGEYNRQIASINEAIQKKKDSVENGDLSRARTELNIFQNQQKRYESDVITLCNEYIEAKTQKATVENQKEEAKRRLDGITEEIITRYQDGINSYLAKFGADFKIVEKKTQYIGGTPSVDYKIKIGERTVSVGDADTPHSEPCFRNTLSDGDKSTLAFAFFMAKLDLDTNLSSKVVVLDDPINSLDIHRRKATVQEIIRKSNQAKQVIILTHDPVFARAIYDNDGFGKALIKCICLKIIGNDSNIQQWDIENETASDFYKSYSKIEEYIEKGSGTPLDVARCIRPVLEGHLRRCFPTSFKSNGNLGSYIKMIREADNAKPIKSLQKYLDELTNINDYATEYQHDRYDGSPVNELTLKSYLNRTLNFLSR
ncbi:MAG: AAA family ATPase [Thermodesulfovibrionia bacterium]|nr:AAA family ATPase [Thermodesulfovibrionia bacterium]